jgi:lactoylglutathione lyase
MHSALTLSLLVLRVSNLERSVAFYSALGLTFECEKHRTGPEHFSAQVGDTLFELYPASERFPVARLRLGFTVTSIEAVLAQWRETGCNVLSGPQASPDGLRAVIADPDGHRIELTQQLKSNRLR